MDVRGSRWAWLAGCAVILICLAGATSAFGQGQQTATLTGTVVDNVGVIPGASITVTNTNTGLVRTAVTSPDGQFRLVSLPPGPYTLKVNMDGFKQIEIANLQLQAGEVRDLPRSNLTLTAGGVTETVNVTAEVTPVQTTSSALQKNLTSDLLTTVQVKGRDIFGLLKILPGVVDSQTSRDFAAWNSGRYLSINGGNSLNKNTTIDGVPVGEEGGNGTTYITPNIDSVAEVNVISSGYTAENGRMASGQVVMVTKSGTNEFKGSAWYNGRRDWMNKNDFFRIKEGSEKPFFAVDITGYSIGGPVIVPKLINSRTSDKKLFFFASQEYTKDIRPSTVLRQNLPTAAQRAGDFTDIYRCPSSCTATRNADGSLASTAGREFITLSNGLGAPDFFCAAGTGGISGVPCVGTAASTNIINPKYFDSMGRSMLNLLPMPNGIYNLGSGQAYSSNDARDNTNDHVRKNLVVRMDTVLSQTTRFSVRGLFDRDDNTAKNNIMPGIGTSDNVFPGNLISGTLTQVIRPTVVNEMTIAWAQNHWGFKRKPGPIEASDYTDWYRGANNPIVGTIPDPPRLAPFGAYREPALRNTNTDQYPYFPYTLFSGGNWANQGYIRPAGSSGALPRWNQNYRYTLADDLTIVKGRHSFKFGFSTERDSKTEPGSQDYVGSYNFGHNSANPFTTGVGYANALIGVFNEYVERDRRIDYEIRHWLTEGYAQDTWRITPRFTLDYGLRLTHNGGLYDVRGFNSAFDPALWQAGQAVSIYQPFCTTGVAGNVSCSSSRQVAVDPLGNQVNRAFIGRVVPGSGDLANGQFTGSSPGMKDGMYNNLRPVSWGPRAGFAWDVFGDGKTAVRGATGVFYNLYNRSYYGFNGGPLISIQRQILQARLSDIATVSAADNPGVTPQNVKIPYGLPLPLYGNSIAPTELQGERHYQGNLAVQRDIGFNTVVEVAWVGNYGRHYRQQKNFNNVPVFAYADPANLFNREAIAADFLRRDYAGIGAINYDTTDEIGLNYNSLQISAQRRLTNGLQMGLAYTLAKGEGMRGWDFVTEELYGASGLRDRYYGPQTTSDQGQERRHVLVVNYSYQIPTINRPVLRWVLGGWEASGVVTAVTGDPINPSCGSDDPSGVANNDPSLSGVGVRCEYVTGQALLSGYDPQRGVGGLAEEDQAHFNLAALQRPLPFGTAFNAQGIVAPGSTGNLGNVGWGVLRNPGWSNWDFTLARRLPVKVGRGGNVRLQLQFYNVFNQVEFRTMNASFNFNDVNATGGFGGGNSTSDTGKYTATQNPFNFGVTIRFDY